MKLKNFSVLFLAIISGCMTAAQHRESVQDNTTNGLTVGTVQKEIRVGMSGGEVAQILGTPNIVTTDEQRQEVWIYDKISTETAYSSNSGGVYALILGFGQSSGANSKTQKTLTVIIKYDENKLVKDFAYHSSSF